MSTMSGAGPGPPAAPTAARGPLPRTRPGRLRLQQRREAQPGPTAWLSTISTRQRRRRAARSRGLGSRQAAQPGALRGRYRRVTRLNDRLHPAPESFDDMPRRLLLGALPVAGLTARRLPARLFCSAVTWLAGYCSPVTCSPVPARRLPARRLPARRLPARRYMLAGYMLAGGLPARRLPARRVLLAGELSSARHGELGANRGSRPPAATGPPELSPPHRHRYPLAPAGSGGPGRRCRLRAVRPGYVGAELRTSTGPHIRLVADRHLHPAARRRAAPALSPALRDTR